MVLEVFSEQKVFGCHSLVVLLLRILHVLVKIGLKSSSARRLVPFVQMAVCHKGKVFLREEAVNVKLLHVYQLVARVNN